MTVLTRVTDNPPDPEDPFDFGTELLLAGCGSCKRACLLTAGVFSDRTPETIWPMKRQLLNAAIPEPLRRELAEARRCFDAKAFTATVVMVRRALEGFCIDQGSTKKMLNLQLRELSESHKIDKRLFDWANGLRALGNAGAHFTGSQVPSVDAQDALDLAEAMFDYVYVFTAKFADFQRRHAEKPASA